MISIKFSIHGYNDNLPACVQLLGSYLKQGSLGLVLGAGGSKAIRLPDWETLVKNLAASVFKNASLSSNFTHDDLKRMSSKIKKEAGEDYLELVKKELYKDIVFDFEYAKKDLLISIMALVVGKTRGNVDHIITYNFDSILEWYLSINGIRVQVSNKQSLFRTIADIEITHLHGYLPSDPEFGENSDQIVFTKEEFEDRQVQYSYWKTVLQDFIRKHVFVTVGLSPESIIDDLQPYIRELDTWYKQENVVREHPYGIAILSPNPAHEKDAEQKEVLMNHGIIPCTVEISRMPHALFQIAKEAMNLS